MTLRRFAVATSLAALMGTGALPVQAVNIPEGGAITPDSTFVFHFRVTSTCDGIPMDQLEVTIPDDVRSPIPEAIAGWDIEILDPADAEEEMAPENEESSDAESAEEENGEAEEDADAEPIVVTWTGGPLDDGQLLDFGMRARFPDAEGEVLAFPVVQRCGLVELEHEPTVTLAKRYGQADFAELSATVDTLSADVEELRADVDQLQEQVGDVNVVNLRTRVRDTENAIEELDGAVAELDERVTALEEEPVPAPTE